MGGYVGFDIMALFFFFFHSLVPENKKKRREKSSKIEFGSYNLRTR